MIWWVWWVIMNEKSVLFTFDTAVAGLQVRGQVSRARLDRLTQVRDRERTRPDGGREIM